MSSRIRLWFVALVFLVALAAQLLGTDALRWYKDAGGPTGLPGIVNLPLAAANHTVSTNVAREGHNMLDLGRGAVLHTPANMNGVVVAVTSSGGVNVDANAVEGAFTVAGKDLVMLRDNGVYEFRVTLVDAEKKTLRVDFILDPVESSYKILVW